MRQPLDPTFSITIENELSREDILTLHQAMTSAIAEEVGPTGYQLLNVTARSGPTLLGALSGSTFWHSFAIDIFWVDPLYRRKGVGTALLEAGEQEAIRRGCNGASFDTFSPTAVAFYERNGYQTACRVDLPGVPATRFVLSKTFA